MSSQKQTEANRLNSRKSTGPRSAEGKAASSMNALKSGIDAQSQIILGEISAHLETLKLEYYARFRPAAPEQRMLVDTLIDCEWLLRRFRTVEAQLWEGGALAVYKPDPDILLALAYDHHETTFARLQRRVDAAHRNYRIALKELIHLQIDRPPPIPKWNRRPPRKIDRLQTQMASFLTPRPRAAAACSIPHPRRLVPTSSCPSASQHPPKEEYCDALTPGFWGTRATLAAKRGLP